MGGWRARRASRQSAWTDCGKRSGGADRRSAFRGLVFFGGEEIRRAYARGGEELARDRRDRAVRPAASEGRACECVYFNNIVSVAADLEKGDAKACLRATSRRSSLPVFMRPSARTGAPQGPAGHRLEVPPSWRSASSALNAVGGTSSDCAFRPRQEAVCAQGGEKNRQTVKHGLPWRKAAPSEMAARRSGRRLRFCWSCRARCGSCAAPCS